MAYIPFLVGVTGTLGSVTTDTAHYDIAHLISPIIVHTVKVAGKYGADMVSGTILFPSIPRPPTLHTREFLLLAGILEPSRISVLTV